MRPKSIPSRLVRGRFVVAFRSESIRQRGRTTTIAKARSKPDGNTFPLGLGFASICFIAYEVLENPFHLVLRNRSDAVAGCDDTEVARRWLLVFPSAGYSAGLWGSGKNRYPASRIVSK